jgi:hypothetical protein
LSRSLRSFPSATARGLRSMRSMRSLFVPAVLAACLIVWLVHVWPSSARRASGGVAVSPPAVSAPAVVKTPAVDASAVNVPAVSVPAVVHVPAANAPPTVGTRAAVNALVVPENARVLPANARSKAAPAAPETRLQKRPIRGTPQSNEAGKISIAAGWYSIRPGERFAEVHVRRSAASRSNASFVWWTESASAQAGSDYVPQARTTQYLSSGARTATLFIRLVPSASRRSPKMFYVVVGNPSAGNSLGRVARTSIFLAPTK